jgi:hypothetical protein
LPVYCLGVNIGLSPWGENVDWGCWEQSVENI